MRTWRGTGILSTLRRTKTWDCRGGVEGSKVRGSGASNSASREWGCAGVRTDFTICYPSDSPGSTARLRRCFRYSSNHPPTRNYAQQHRPHPDWRATTASKHVMNKSFPMSLCYLQYSIYYRNAYVNNKK